MKYFFLLVFLCCSVEGFSQKVALKNNLAYDALKTPNLSLELSIGRKWTLDTQVGMNFFFYTQDATSSHYRTKKISHWLVQPRASLLDMRCLQRLVLRSSHAWGANERWRC